MTQIDRNLVIQRLLELPEEIIEAEHSVIKASLDVEEAKRELAEKEADLYNGGKVEGRNEAQRKACLLSLTATERATIAECEENLLLCRKNYNHRLNGFSALKTVASILAGEVS